MTEQTQTTPDPADEQNEQATAEDASDETASDEQTTEELIPVEDQPWFDDVFSVLHPRAVDLADKVNAEVDWLNSHSSDLLTVVETVEQDNSDDKIKAANDKLEELKSEVLRFEKLRRDYAMTVAKALVAERKDSDAMKAHEESHGKARTAYRDYIKVFKSNYEGADITPYMPEVRNLKRKSTTKGQGGTRMRGFAEWKVDGKVVGGNQDGEFKSTASHAATEAKVDLTELQNEYKRLNGDDPKSWPHYCEFEFKGHKFEATRESKTETPPSADVSPSSTESTNGQATS